MNYWFTSDLHLGHANIIKYCDRPFDSLEQMNDTIIQRWNERVKPDDVVYHIGDFCFKNSNDSKGEGVRTSAIEWEKLLNGKIIFIRGNHDKNNSCKTNMLYIVIQYGGKNIGLIHNFEHIKKYGLDKLNIDYFFVGHVHNNYLTKDDEDISAINVGVDMWNFYPVCLNQIQRFI